MDIGKRSLGERIKAEKNKGIIEWLVFIEGVSGVIRKVVQGRVLGEVKDLSDANRQEKSAIETLTEEESFNQELWRDIRENGEG